MSEQSKKTRKELADQDKENIKKHLKDRGQKKVSEAYFEKNEKRRWI